MTEVVEDQHKALYIAYRHSREDVRQRALMQQKLAQKDRVAKEENLRLLTQRSVLVSRLRGPAPRL
jgi:hypothetical protein